MAGPARPRTPALRTDSLAYALSGAAHAVAIVAEGSALPQALASVFRRLQAPPQARGAIQDIAYRTMRQRASSDALLAQLSDRPVSPPTLHALLACSLALLQPAAGEDPGSLPYEAFTVVDQAVAAAGANPALARAKGMVNAVLRRFLREQAALLPALQHDPVTRWNHPRWWIDALRSAYPDSWQAILEAGNRPPPLTLRVNLRRVTPEDYLARLAAAGISARQIGPQAVRLDRALPVGQIPGFDEGLVSV
ncbi:MAG TPA: transcription antitermination factor NusB, partial [Noviherbaspirillum sp.]|nr:transcription antitermination factor NusB [Noviherbaspirillum sp.]